MVPYRPEHVERYHEWMQSPDLLEATGSEPLSLQEEYEMQQSWRDDPSKCTFIVLAKEKCDMGTTMEHLDSQEDNDFVNRNLDAMVGDVNLFLSEQDSEDVSDEQEGFSTTDENENEKMQAEVDIMIAERWGQRKGIGKEATSLMIQYATSHLNIARFFCKINEDNTPSRNMFQKSLGFIQCDYAECFRQYEYELRRTSGDSVETLLGSRVIESFQCRVSPQLES